MGRQPPSLSSHSRSDDAEPYSDAGSVECPFGKIESLGRSAVREAAYEIFFMSCRSSPGFGSSKGSQNYNPALAPEGSGSGGVGGGEGSPKTAGSVGMTVPHSRIKKALGLKTRRSSPMRTGMAGGPNSPGKVMRPMTSAEIMRTQMRVTEQSDHRLRKTLMRTLVGQASKKSETIILPLELLRQVKPTEFCDVQEYHQWQRRQLKILEAGLILYPSIPLDLQNPAAIRLLELIRASETKPIDTSKNSEVLQSLCNYVVALAWRNSAPTEACHWVDGYPLNIHLYLALLRSIFDLREETVVLDEVDELIELMKRTWPYLGINRAVHNLCFAWGLFQQYIDTGRVEPDLVGATVVMLGEVASDARRPDRDTSYVKLLVSALSVMQGWAERKMVEYHECFDKDTTGSMESVLALAVLTSKIIGEDLPGGGISFVMDGDAEMGLDRLASRVDFYVKSSIRSAFTKILENGAAQSDSMVSKTDEHPTNILIHLANDTEELALFEKEVFSPVLKKWHPAPMAAAAVTIHSCFGIVLKQYLGKVTSLTNELVRVLISAGKLEKLLAQMAVEDSVNDGGRWVMREMVPYEIDSIVGSLLKNWISERLRIGKECVDRAKETESWMPRSKTEPYAQSVMDLMKLAKVTVDEFFEIPVGIRDDMVQELADGLESLFQDYVTFTSACGTKQSYMPSLPPLTRCNQDSKLVKLWKRTACRTGNGRLQGRRRAAASNTENPRPSTSRGTQRLYIRLNSLHYLIANLNALDKSLTFARSGLSPSGRLPAGANRRLASSHHFELVRSAAQTAIQYVSDVAAYRLIFLDSRLSFYDGLYVDGVAESRIRPGLRTLKQNLTLLVSVLTDRAQPQAVKEVMRAAFEALLMVLLAGGRERAFVREDYEAVLEDFRSLKRVFCTCGEGLVAEEVVGREAEVVEGILSLMGLPTERLIEDFSIASFEASGMRVVEVGGKGGSAMPKVPMPPTTGRWNRAEPNTVLRVLCYRNDDMANQFLKRTFGLAKRR